MIYYKISIGELNKILNKHSIHILDVLAEEKKVNLFKREFEIVFDVEVLKND